ncbi:MAG: hypothetical protein FD137_2296, partial [Spirochaetes bacterium]
MTQRTVAVRFEGVHFSYETLEVLKDT